MAVREQCNKKQFIYNYTTLPELLHYNIAKVSDLL